MGLWEDLVAGATATADAVSSTADVVADVAEAVVTVVGDVAADVIETAGNGVQDAAGFIDEQASQLPLVGPVLSGFPAYLGDVVAGATNLAGAVVKGVVGIAGGLVAGAIRIVGGVLVLDADLVLKGLIDIISSIAGAVVLIMGQLVSFIQRLLQLQSDDRPLTKEERAMVREVFHKSLALYNVRVVEGRSGLFGVFDRTTEGAGLTLGNTIYMKRTRPERFRSVLIHECVHVWQYQTVGARYTTDALGAQWRYGRGPRGAYDWLVELAERGHERWWEFNEEAQAEFMQDVWDSGELTVRDVVVVGQGAFFRWRSYLGDLVTARFEDPTAGDFTQFAQESVAAMRARVNLRLSEIASPSVV
jgi:hypothetical protein